MHTYPFVALCHETTKSNFKKMKKSGKIRTAQELLFERYDPGFGSGGFPGVYFSLLYKNQIPELIDNDNILLIFPIDLLLKTQNWHYNLIDKNGSITYDTYYKHNILSAPNPKTLEEFCKLENNVWPGNELVFHDSISLKYLHSIITKDNIKQFKTDKCIRSPKHIKFNNSKLPVIVSMSDNKYTGIKYKFYNKPKLDTVLDKDYCKWMSSILPVLNNKKLNKKEDYDSFLIINEIIPKLMNNEIPRSSQDIDKFFKIHDKISGIKSKYYIGKYGGIKEN